MGPMLKKKRKKHIQGKMGGGGGQAVFQQNSSARSGLGDKDIIKFSKETQGSLERRLETTLYRTEVDNLRH